jgi:antitoxin component of RelBE/YafQ-DinJ toxin-antitoxin module
MWKSLFKALGLPILEAVRPFLAKVVAEKDAHAKLRYALVCVSE